MSAPRRDVAERLDARRRPIVSRVVDRHFEADDTLARRYGLQGRARCAEDAAFHLDYLAEALRAGSAPLFVDYVVWARELLESRHVPAADLAANLNFLERSIRDELGEADGDAAAEYLEPARAVLGGAAQGRAVPGLSDLARRYLLALLEGDRAGAENLVVQAAADGMPIRDIYIDVFQAAQRELGHRWQRNQLTVAQEHLCTAATERIMARLLARHAIHPRLRRGIVITSVAAEQHAFGPRVLADFFEMEGWDVHYLGADTPAVSVVEIVRDRRASVLAISATMAYHIANVRDLIIRVRARADLGEVKVLVGGRPFNVEPGLWRSVGADGFAHDAPSAVAAARRLTD